MISKMTTSFLICLIILYGLFTLSYDLVYIGDQNGIMKVFATSGNDSGDSAGNSEEASDDSSPDDSSPDDSSPDDSSPDDSSPSSSEDAPDDPAVECSGNKELIDGECREVPSASDLAQSGSAGAASSPGALSAMPAEPSDPTGFIPSDPSDLIETSEMASGSISAELGTSQNVYSQPDSDRFHHNSEDIALELSSLTPLQIAEYPFTELSDNDLMLALSFLAPSDLGKVLTNIPANDLVVVKERLGESKFNEFLSKVSVPDREVLEKILPI